MPTLTDSRLHAVVSPSWLLRQQAVEALLAGWDGEVKRVFEPEDFQSLVLGLDTPSIFGSRSAWVVRGSETWLRRNTDILLPLIGVPVASEVLVLAAVKLARNESLGRQLDKAGVYQLVEPPVKGLTSWLVRRLQELPQGVRDAAGVAEALIDRCGEDADALLMGVEHASLHAGDAPLTVADVDACLGGNHAAPPWTIIEALLKGDADKAIALMVESQTDAFALLGALVSDVRACLACLDLNDEDEVLAAAGIRNKQRLFYVRRRAQELGRRTLKRVLHGTLHCHRQLRQNGNDPPSILIGLAINLRRVIRSVGVRPEMVST